MVNILVSNDDGIFAPGLYALATAMLKLGRVWVVAPENNQSASGHRKTLNRPLRAVPTYQVFPSEIVAFAVDGAPSDCTALAVMGLIEEKIDLVVAGVNSGPNLGQDLTYSGTASVAFEAAIFSLPAIAFSLDNRSPDADYQPSAVIARKITEQVIKHGLPRHTVLNVNIPNRPLHEIGGVQITQQGIRDYRDVLDKRIDPFGRPYYWIGGVEPSGDVEAEGTDIWAVYNGYVSITPVHLYMTRHEFIAPLTTWDWDYRPDSGPNHAVSRGT
jgi:5'-nucleotidase